MPLHITPRSSRLPSLRLRSALVAAGLALSLPVAWAQSGWQYCADEGQSCNAGSGALLRFGIDDKHNARRLSGRVACNVGTFGDPAPRQRKRCEIWQNTGAWTPCAAEDQTCELPGPARVRYGGPGRWTEREVEASVLCGNREFGDPLPGQPKGCEFRLESGGSYGPTHGAWGGWGGSAAGAGSSNVGLPWQLCAREGAQCNLRGPAMLRYGGAGRYVYREVSGSLRCDNDALGGDPAPGMTKQCETLRLGR